MNKWINVTADIKRLYLCKKRHLKLLIIAHTLDNTLQGEKTTGKIKFIVAGEFCGVISLSISRTKERIIILLAQTTIFICVFMNDCWIVMRRFVFFPRFKPAL